MINKGKEAHQINKTTDTYSGIDDLITNSKKKNAVAVFSLESR
jgi:hypothetical protein